MPPQGQLFKATPECDGVTLVTQLLKVYVVSTLNPFLGVRFSCMEELEINVAKGQVFKVQTPFVHVALTA